MGIGGATVCGRSAGWWRGRARCRCSGPPMNSGRSRPGWALDHVAKTMFPSATGTTSPADT